MLVTLGSTARELVEQFAKRIHRRSPEFPERSQSLEHACLWNLREGEEVVLLDQVQPIQKHHRHSGKYVAGDVGAWHSFHFPALGQSAANLNEFLSLSTQLADPALRRHMDAGDFSNWFRQVIRDDVLANKTRVVETDTTLTPKEALSQVTWLVQSRYHL
ncbi:hypothetical protein [Pseudomonas viciae]|uniref:hypothetical protein n=1 Tax=Pseudomonas viciae TaxID=2505979 RepID=UPI0022349FFD|nr:hypothetical protein [Pseudomonas viciae]UZE84044.1 hypothetical protein LOY66_15520 [Pseudomonas viciae]